MCVYVCVFLSAHTPFSVYSWLQPPDCACAREGGARVTKVKGWEKHGMSVSNSTATRQTPLTCPGHTRPVVCLHFSGVTPSGSYFISACKGKSNIATCVFCSRHVTCCRWQANVTSGRNGGLDRHVRGTQGRCMGRLSQSRCY